MMIKKISMTLLATLFVAILFSCKKNDSSVSPIIDGKWFQIADSSLRTPVAGGSSITTVNHFTKSNFYVNGNSITFSDGLAFDSSYYTIVDSFYKHADTVRCALNGSTLTFSNYSKYSPVSGHSQFQASVSGNMLTLYSTYSDTTFNTSTNPKTILSIVNVKDWLIFSK